MPLEAAICVAAAALRRRGTGEFHGFLIAKALAHAADTRLLTAYGTLYRALARLEKMGLVRSRPEDPHIAAQENRPARRLYTLMATGEAAARDAAAAGARIAPSRKPVEGLDGAPAGPPEHLRTYPAGIRTRPDAAPRIRASGGSRRRAAR